MVYRNVVQKTDDTSAGRIVARCTVGGGDLGEWIVLNGWAVAYAHVSYEYTRAEYWAKRAHRGNWAGRLTR